jgi:hypothetical protein
VKDDSERKKSRGEGRGGGVRTEPPLGPNILIREATHEQSEVESEDCHILSNPGTE